MLVEVKSFEIELPPISGGMLLRSERRPCMLAFVLVDETIMEWVVKCFQEPIDVDGRHRLVLKIRIDDKVVLVLCKENSRGRFHYLSMAGRNGKEICCFSGRFRWL